MSVLLLAADTTSKVPFYIAGGVFAVWAVALASVGLTRPAFPYNARGQGAVIAISAVLLIAAIGTAIVTA